MKKILIVEDDAAISFGLAGVLEENGYAAHVARSGEEGLQRALQEKPDLLILDLMLPGMSGLELCKRLRDQGLATPVIMLTARTGENDKILGLELGADDYVTKPFSLRELLARVRARLRHEETAIAAQASGKPDKCCFGEVVIDFKRHEVLKSSILQELTNREFKLLEYFVHHPGELLSRERLLNEIWGYVVYPSTRTVDNHIMRLRKHIEPEPENPRYIKTVRGAGYLFEGEVAAQESQHATPH